MIRCYIIYAGDYVDRGAWGVELVLAIATLKLAMPAAVFMLRGNHESDMCTKYYGFQPELRSKYPPRGAVKPALLIKGFIGVSKRAWIGVQCMLGRGRA